MSFFNFSLSPLQGGNLLSKHSRIVALFFLFLSALVASTIYNGERSLWDTSETRYAEASREMTASGNWMVPMLAGTPHLTKPPLTYWVLAAAMKLFGFSEAAVRFPVALAFALTVVATAGLGWRMTSSFEKGMLAGIYYLVSPLPFLGGHVVTTDTFVALWVVLYLSCFWRVTCPAGEGSVKTQRLLMYFFLGLAFLTKGPPALLPALAAVLYLIVSRQWNGFKVLLSAWGALVFALIAGSWYITVLFMVPHALEVWKLEAVHKVFVNSDRDMPAIYYPLLLFAGTIPSVLVICWHVFRQRYVKGENRIGLNGNKNKLLFLSLWLVVPMIVFMLSRTRMILYVLPLAPSVSLLASIISPSNEGGKMKTTGNFRTAFVIALQLLVLVGVKVYVAQRGDLSKDMKPLAMVISQDSRNHNTLPALVLTQEKMGNGLLYYLNGPPVQRVVKEEGVRMSNIRLLTNALVAELPRGYSRYIVVDNSDMRKIEDRLETSLKLIYSNSQWGIFRQESAVGI